MMVSPSRRRHRPRAHASSAHEEAVRAAITAGKTCTASALGPDSKTRLNCRLAKSWCAHHSRANPVRARLRYLNFSAMADCGRGAARSAACDVMHFRQKIEQALRGRRLPRNFMVVLNFSRALDDPLVAIVGRPRRSRPFLVNQWPKITIVERAMGILTKVPAQFLLQATSQAEPMFAFHIEGGNIMAPRGDSLAR